MVVLIIICANEKDLEMAFGSSDDTVGAVRYTCCAALFATRAKLGSEAGGSVCL